MAQDHQSDTLTITYIPRPADESHDTGKIVITIKVDKDGYVVEAKCDKEKSTVRSEKVIRKYESSAMKARATANPNGPEYRYGVITYRLTFR